MANFKSNFVPEKVPQRICSQLREKRWRKRTSRTTPSKTQKTARRIAKFLEDNRERYSRKMDPTRKARLVLCVMDKWRVFQGSRVEKI